MSPQTSPVDLSHKLDPNNMSILEGMPKFVCCPLITIEEHGASMHSITLGSHTGTHLDAPSHFIPNGKSVDQIPLSSLCGKALVIDLTYKKDKEPITWNDFQPYIEKMKPGVILLLHTGWSKYWASGPRFFEHPYLDVDAAKEILGLGISVIGLDVPSPDLSGTNEYPVHQAVLGAGGVIVENLTNLGELGEEPMVNLLPLNIVGCDGAPVRGVGWDVQ